MIEYLNFEELPRQPYWNSLCWLHDSIFTGQGSSTISTELEKRSRFLILLAIDSDGVIGYKIGYEERTGRFYSWLGGVNPELRGRGIASELMRRQHKWCRDNDYQVIRTLTKNKWRDMLILNSSTSTRILHTHASTRVH